MKEDRMTIPQNITVEFDLIDQNPHRQLGRYPFVERKLEALMRSYRDVGMWPGVIARKVGDRYQLAFGHHRHEAARRFGLPGVMLTVMDLTDEQMLQYMGRENLEDYRADFMTMLQSWESAMSFCYSRSKNTQLTDIARLLGWTSKHDFERDDGVLHRGDQPSRVARACHDAALLLKAGHIELEDLADLTVSEAQEICGRAQTRISQLEKASKSKGISAKEIADAKKHVGKAVSGTAKDVRSGRISKRDIGAQVDVRAYNAAKDAKKRTPLFAVFGKALSDQIARTLNGDTMSVKLDEIEKSLGNISTEEDQQIIGRLAFDLEQLRDRAELRRRRVSKPTPVVRLVRSQS